MSERRDSRNRKLRTGEYQRQDGRYAYRYKDCGGVDRWVYSWKLVATDPVPEGKSADICLRDMEKDLLKSTLDGINSYGADHLTLNRRFEGYLHAKAKLKKQTLISYRRIWRCHVEDTLGKRSIGSIYYSDILELYAELMKTKRLAKGTMKNINLLLEPVFDIAVRDGLIRANPATGALQAAYTKKKTERSIKEKALTKDQQKIFLDWLRKQPKYNRWLRLIIFLLGTGCRIGEARGLTWADCDFEKGLIHIDHQLAKFKDSDGAEREHVVDPKSDHGTRVIPMLNEVREVLTEEKAWQEECRIESATVDGVSGFIFLRKTGNPIDISSTKRAFKMLIKHCNEETGAALPDFSAHDLRHTFCTRLCENESNVKLIQEIMGHSSIQVTMNVYAEVHGEQKVKSFEALEGKII